MCAMTGSPDDRPRSAQDPARDVRSFWARLPGWTKVACGVAGAMLVASLVLYAVESGSPPEPGAGGQGAGGGSNLLPQGIEPGGQPSAAEGEPGWSLGLFKMGFSFFVGLSIGFALRTFVKVVLFACGLSFLLLFWLTSIELVIVDWPAMDRMFENLGTTLSRQFESLKTLVTGSLPATGLATLGLVAGFRKR
jgi:uncharacterized membrane protein (Fun14 family)